MRRAWPPVYRPPPQQKVVSAAAMSQMQSPTTAAATRYRRESVAAAAAAGACFVIAAPCSCSPPLTVRNQQQYSAYHQHRGPPPPLPARNGCPYRCCVDGRPQKSSSHPAVTRSPLQRPHQQQHKHVQQQQQQPHHQQQQLHSQRRCAYVRPRPSRSLENLLRVVELDDPAAVADHRGVYEKSCHYGNPRRKMKATGKENRHAWKRRSMESLLSARDVTAKNFEFFHHPTSTAAIGSTKTAGANHTGDGLLDGSAYNSDQNGKPRFIAVTRLEDVQAVRCAEFHPHGSVYAVGSNSKTLRICAYPKVTDIRENHVAQQPTVLFKRTRHHKGSIYCMSWTPDGSLIATGSNDKTVKLMRFNADTSNLEGQEIELAMHDGTVRDVCFIEDTTNRSSLLISGGAGDCKIYVTDCETGQPYQALSGHSGHILTLYNWGGAMFVSGSHDRTIRFWDLRTRGCVNVVTPNTSMASRQGSPVAAVCVEPSGRLLVSGHEDSACVLYDIRGSRSLQCFKPHSADVRSLRFSPSAYYLLTGGYDNKLVLTDLQGDLTTTLPSVVVAQHQDKVISGRWHPTDFSFLSTSADKTTTLWALPPYK
ncbi:WD repeat-containing protein 47 isoform X3 [Acyrthosiphon pisum]|uniref:WD repeat-containing protein 47 n=1 Tax=Acyrthosiphon pisum TaxID=7029 RepID=A0A8R2AZT5_ACYPI|nr:WD repeat-containing protein 47 isoform X3 [Acyrthosiphon pisum]|eukprot:XP_008180049.1 PREDICTED: WD repeat-containing protein 47 isoform X3 [Acyrthosiphon pisum]